MSAVALLAVVFGTASAGELEVKGYSGPLHVDWLGADHHEKALTGGVHVAQLVNEGEGDMYTFEHAVFVPDNAKVTVTHDSGFLRTTGVVVVPGGQRPEEAPDGGCVTVITEPFLEHVFVVDTWALASDPQDSSLQMCGLAPGKHVFRAFSPTGDALLNGTLTLKAGEKVLFVRDGDGLMDKPCSALSAEEKAGRYAGACG